MTRVYAWRSEPEWLSSRIPMAILGPLAAVYKDHPDYRQEWA